VSETSLGETLLSVETKKKWSGMRQKAKIKKKRKSRGRRDEATHKSRSTRKTGDLKQKNPEGRNPSKVKWKKRGNNGGKLAHLDRPLKKAVNRGQPRGVAKSTWKK